jgi:hypothetical protein
MLRSPKRRPDKGGAAVLRANAGVVLASQKRGGCMPGCICVRVQSLALLRLVERDFLDGQSAGFNVIACHTVGGRELVGV